jgi:uncharacterized protein YbbC (DUF1343 family)
MFDKVVGNAGVRPAFFRRHRVEDILPIWNKDADAFRATKRKYQIYE